jgi:hypothetical protein
VESVRFVGIDLKVIAWDEHDGCAVAEDWLEVPPAVDATNVEQYVLGRFGDPTDVAVGTTDEFGELVMGWVFPSTALSALELPSEGLELMVVPFVRFRDGSRRELFEYTAELEREFTALVGPLDAGSTGLGERPPSETRTRLEQEHLSLWSAELELVEEQLAGWLRRMVREGWTYLIIEVADTGRYVQYLSHDGDWLRGEVVGDRYLPDDQQLSTHELRSLADIGWNAPGEHGDPSGNHWVEWGDGDDLADELADDRDEPPAGPLRELAERDLLEAARFGAAAVVGVFDLGRPDRAEVSTGHASHAGD